MSKRKNRRMKVELIKGESLEFKGVNSIEEVGEIGIDNIKTVARFAVKLGRKIKRYKRDGKIRGFEILGLSIQLIGAVKLIPLWKMVLAELSNLREDEYDQIIDIIADGFGINIESAKDYFIDFSGFIEALTKLFNKEI